MLIHCSKVRNKKKSILRKKASSFAFAVYDSVSEINVAHWNSIVDYGSEYLKNPFLSVIEKEQPDNMHFHYAIIYDSKKPVAIAYFQVINLTSNNFGNVIEKEESKESCLLSDYLRKHLTNHIIKRTDKINIRILICGNACVSGEHGFTCIPEADKTEVMDVLSDVIYYINQLEKPKGKITAILIKDFYSSSIPYAKELEEYKYHDFLVEPNMVVNMKWKTFEEYLNAMSTKYRQRAKNIIKKGAEIQRVSFCAEDILKHSTEISQLYNNVQTKAKFRMASVTPAYFEQMKKVLGDQFEFVAYFFNQKLIGFKTSFILKKEVEAHFIGLDYSVNKELELYQNMLYDYVQDAILKKSTQLILGRTASEIKSTIGAEALQLTCYIRHRNPLSNQIIKPLVDYLKPSNWIPRNPFKVATS